MCMLQKIGEHGAEVMLQHACNLFPSPYTFRCWAVHESNSVYFMRKSGLILMVSAQMLCFTGIACATNFYRATCQWYNLLSSELFVKIKLPESLQDAKTLYKLEKSMTTQRKLVEELRLECSSLYTSNTCRVTAVATTRTVTWICFTVFEWFTCWTLHYVGIAWCLNKEGW